MDMSFANQALCSEFIAKSQNWKPKFTRCQKKLMKKLLSSNFKAMGIKIDELTEEQKKYLSTWEMGTT
jgi:adenosylhomocysteinase